MDHLIGGKKVRRPAEWSVRFAVPFQSVVKGREHPEGLWVWRDYVEGWRREGFTIDERGRVEVDAD